MISTPTVADVGVEPVSRDDSLDEALKAAARGWLVFPVHSAENGLCSCGNAMCVDVGKHPMTTHGHLEATTDIPTIRRWWAAHPGANLGIRTGRESGIVVLDVDPAAGGDDSVHALEAQSGSLPHTIRALTGGGGHHQFFAHPGFDVPTKARLAGWAGLDIRGDGGYVVGPPSRHKSGGRYVWDLGAHPDEVAAAPLPDWLVSMFVAPKPRTTASTVGSRIREGERDDTLASLAGTMRRRGMSQGAITAALLVENIERCDPPLADGQVRKVASSISRYEPDEPSADSSELQRPREYSGNDLLSSESATALIESLPVLGLSSYVVKGWSHLVAGYPRCGKTELLVRLVREWLDRGLNVLFITEEPQAMWRARLSKAPGDWSALRVYFGLGRAPRELRRRAFDGAEDVVVLDAARNLLQFSDENDNSEVARVVNPWIVDARRSGKTFICAHHNRKGSGEHGEGIAGGHALLGAFDVGLEMTFTNGAQPKRRTLRAYSRVVSPPTFVYEMRADGSFAVLGAPDQIALQGVKDRVIAVLTSEWETTSGIHEALGDPKPAKEQVRLALLALAEETKVDRDPPPGAQDTRGRAHRWRLR
jgi:hypothetical protein